VRGRPLSCTLKRDRPTQASFNTEGQPSSHPAEVSAYSFFKTPEIISPNLLFSVRADNFNSRWQKTISPLISVFVFFHDIPF
jgi:hypothetical protein